LEKNKHNQLKEDFNLFFSLFIMVDQFIKEKIMLRNLRTNKILWYITTGFTFVAAVVGSVIPNLYNGLFPREFIPGAWPQDVLTVLICLILFILIHKMKDDDTKLQIVIMGIIGSFFYLYGIFTIERVYNFLYILYAAIFALSFWTLVYNLASIKAELLQRVELSKGMLKTSAVSAIVIALLFTFLWISALVPLMREHNRIEYLYSIYILDLCFIMPAFFITAVMSLRRRGFGILFMPAIFVIGFFVIFPLGLGEIAKPYYGQATNIGSMMVSFVFSIFMLVVGFLHLHKLKLK